MKKGNYQKYHTGMDLESNSSSNIEKNDARFSNIDLPHINNVELDIEKEKGPQPDYDTSTISEDEDKNEKLEKSALKARAGVLKLR